MACFSIKMRKGFVSCFIQESFLISQEQNDIKKNSVQLGWNNTLLCCQLLIYIMKKEKKYIKIGGDIKPDSVNNPNGQKQKMIHKVGPTLNNSNN